MSAHAGQSPVSGLEASRVATIATAAGVGALLWPCRADRADRELGVSTVQRVRTLCAATGSRGLGEGGR
jgi:hypothetical protein